MAWSIERDEHGLPARMWWIPRAKPTWRESVALIIRRVIDENPGITGAPLMRLLRERYPFGRMKGYPYKVWRDEIQKALGVMPRRTRKPARLEGMAGQQELF